MKKRLIGLAAVTLIFMGFSGIVEAQKEQEQNQCRDLKQSQRGMDGFCINSLLRRRR